MNLVDSSGWLEYFADGKNAKHFAKAIEATHKLIVPSISILEVFKRIYVQLGEDSALQAVALMQQGRIIELDLALSLRSAKLGVELKLPLADSVILATARTWNALLWTQDSDFHNIEGVKYFPKN
jgi:predicted nucleic acid-binding protein